jgi:hypothetical protein
MEQWGEFCEFVDFWETLGVVVVEFGDEPVLDFDWV